MTIPDQLPAANLSTSAPIKVALIGCGAVAELYYAPALTELVNHQLVELAALYDPSPERIAKLGMCFPSATRLGDLSDLAAHKVTLAVVASPPGYHAEQSIQLMKSGIAVLCEKPMATTVKDAADMIDAGKQSGVVFAVGLFRRFFPVARAVRHVISSGLLGAVESFSFSESGGYGWPMQTASLYQKSIAGGGVLLDFGVHVVDLCVYWFGVPNDVTYEDDAMGGIEANCRLTLSYGNRLQGTIRLSRESWLPSRLIIECQNGCISWEPNRADLLQLGFRGADFVISGTLHEREKEDWLSRLGPPMANYQESFMNQLLNVINAVRSGDELVVPGEEAIKSLRIIESCYGQRKLMDMPWLSGDEQAAATKLSSCP